jgi:hypothetical protein
MSLEQSRPGSSERLVEVARSVGRRRGGARRFCAAQPVCIAPQRPATADSQRRSAPPSSHASAARPSVDRRSIPREAWWVARRSPTPREPLSSLPRPAIRVDQPTRLERFDCVVARCTSPRRPRAARRPAPPVVQEADRRTSRSAESRSLSLAGRRVTCAPRIVSMSSARSYERGRATPVTAA